MGTSWINGVEAWCQLVGKYVSFVRKEDAQMPLSGNGEIVICTFGVIADNMIKRDEEVADSVEVGTGEIT